MVNLRFEWTVSLATQAQETIKLENQNFDAAEKSLNKINFNLRSRYIETGEEEGKNSKPNPDRKKDSD